MSNNIRPPMPASDDSKSPAPKSLASKSPVALAREERLAAKLRENLKRRKSQARARADAQAQTQVPDEPGKKA